MKELLTNFSLKKRSTSLRKLDSVVISFFLTGYTGQSGYNKSKEIM